MTAGQLTLQDAVRLMIVLSDNTATNLVIERLGADAVNARLDALGLRRTRLLRKIGGGGASRAAADPANAGFGIGVSTSREMVELLAKLERGEVVVWSQGGPVAMAITRRRPRRGRLDRRQPGPARDLEPLDGARRRTLWAEEVKKRRKHQNV